MKLKTSEISPFVSFDSLKHTLLGSFVLHGQPVEGVRSQILWISPEALKRHRNARKLLLKCAVQTARIPEHPTHAQWKKMSSFLREDVLIDSYVCEGADTLGSGRSCFVGKFQVKGIGRTVLAPPPARTKKLAIQNHFVSDGRCESHAIYTEVILSRWISQLLEQPVIPQVGVLKDESENLLLVREGTPIRLAHLLLMKAGSNQFGTGKKSRTLWQNFFNAHLGQGPSNVSPKIFSRYREHQFRSAANLTAACRVFGVTLSDYSDNFDINHRPFDMEDVKVCFKCPPSEAPNPRFNRSRFRLTDWLEQFQADEFSDRRMKTLQTMSCTTKATNLFASLLLETGLKPIRDLEIENFYETALRYHLQRLTGLSDPRVVEQLRKKIGRSLDLIPSLETKEFRFDDFLNRLLLIHKNETDPQSEMATPEGDVSAWLYNKIRNQPQLLNRISKRWENNLFLISEEGLYSKYIAIKFGLMQMSRKKSRETLKTELEVGSELIQSLA